MVHTHEHYKPNVIVGYTKTIVSKHKSRGYIVLIIVSVENGGTKWYISVSNQGITLGENYFIHEEDTGQWN